MQNDWRTKTETLYKEQLELRRSYRLLDRKDYNVNIFLCGFFTLVFQSKVSESIKGPDRSEVTDEQAKETSLQNIVKEVNDSKKHVN